VTIRSRLTLWYAALLAIVLIAFALIAFEAMRVSAIAAADDELRSRIDDTREMMRGGLTPAVRAELARHAGDVFVLRDANGHVVYESAAARTMGFDPRRMRVATASTADLTVTMAIPLKPYEATLDRFGVLIAGAIPLALLVAAGGGWWLSGRALKPVDRMTREARTITAQNLDRRVALPEEHDELRLLGETLNAMLDRLETSFRRIAQFTADASHELRSPVALMRTTAEVALRKTRSEAEYREALQQVLNESERVTRLIEDLLLLARSDAATDVLEKRPLDLAEPLRAAVARVDRVRLTIESPAIVEANGAALQQLFAILLDNAVKYSDDEVSVSLRGAIVEIRDRGIGISPADLPHIFERFYRADKARSHGGSGLGLAIAHRIAEIHGATIDVASTPGAGTTFTVRFLV